jgi:O-methyltransferase
MTNKKTGMISHVSDAKHSLGRAKYRLLEKAKTVVDPEEKLMDRVRPYTMSSRLKLKNLKRLAELVNRNGVPGDFVECGTFKGGSAAVISTALTPERRLWLFDSFEGLPDVKEIDGQESKEWVGKCRAAEDDVSEALAKVGTSSDQYLIRKGWFQETFKADLPKQVALLHCDADWYDSVLLTLETFYDRIPSGGAVVLDDFGWWEGCREAFYDFCSRHREKPLLERVDCDQAYWIKGKTDNRDRQGRW